MHLFSKKAAKKMAAYQKELIETHYQEVDNMYRQMRGGAMIIAIISKQ